MPRRRLGPWRRSTSSATTATAAPVSGVPAWTALRDAAAGARLDRILITAPDRLARNYVHQVLLVEELQKHGAVVEFLDRPMSQDPHDQLLLQIRGAVAEYERTLITERMRRGRLRKLQAGPCCPGPGRPTATGLTPSDRAIRPGFGWTRRRRRLCVTCSPGSPTRASVSALARRLHRLGIVSPRGHRSWSLPALRGC